MAQPIDNKINGVNISDPICNFNQAEFQKLEMVVVSGYTITKQVAKSKKWKWWILKKVVRDPYAEAKGRYGWEQDWSWWLLRQGCSQERLT